MRTLILDRIRTALIDVPIGERPRDVPVAREYLRAETEAAPRLTDLFAERVAEYRAHVVRATGSDASAAIERLLRIRGITTLVVPPGLPAEMLGDAGPDRLSDTPPLSTARLEAADGVITTCAFAIAGTGTIVLDAGPGQGRRALSLLPDYHLCVVRVDQIVADVPAAINRLDPSRPITMISGPSATSDIENNRIEGVHGPRTLDILIINEQE